MPPGEWSVGLWRQLSARFGGWLVAANALALMLLSWTPGTYMVRTSLSGHLEHALAYVLSGAFMFAVLPRRRPGWQVAAGLAAYAGLLELGQLFVTGRHSAFEDFAFSAAGAVIGVFACAAALRRLL
jgi:VanZ family protein